jgi:hypothetical protein
MFRLLDAAVQLRDCKSYTTTKRSGRRRQRGGNGGRDAVDGDARGGDEFVGVCTSREEPARSSDWPRERMVLDAAVTRRGEILDMASVVWGLVLGGVLCDR